MKSCPTQRSLVNLLEEFLGSRAKFSSIDGERDYSIGFRAVVMDSHYLLTAPDGKIAATSFFVFETMESLRFEIDY